MAMHNFGPNSLQHEQQLKHQQQTSSGTDTSSWHNSNSSSNTTTNNNNNINVNNNNNNNTPNISNSDHTNDSHQSSAANYIINNDHKAPGNSPPTTNNQATNRTLNRQQQQQQHHQQLQSQSQQYHGIFSPQIPASLQSSLASRVDQIIRTTLHDSPAYTPPISKNNNNDNPGNSSVLNSTQANSSNMPSPSSTSSLIFNSTTSTTSSSSSTPHNNNNNSTLGHPPNTNIGLVSTAPANAPITSIYGSPISNMSDNLNSGANGSNLSAKTSPSHSALAAAAALQSLNQSHVQRSHQQQLAHTQPSPFLNFSGASKPQFNDNGTPLPQAAHAGSNAGNHQMPKLCITSMSNSDHHHQNQLNFNPEHPDGLVNFASRLQPNSNAGNSNNLSNKMPPQSSSLSLSTTSWQDQVNHANGILPRLPPVHGGVLNQTSMPPFSPISYGIMNPQLGSGGGIGSNNMIGQQDSSDNLSKLNAMKNTPGQSNPMQFRDEKSFPTTFPTLLSNKQNQPDLDNLRGPPANPEAVAQERITEEKLAVFAYNLLSVGVPGKQQYKKIVQLDDDMRNSIQNGEFYTKYGHVANGILTNQIICPNFSIIDYLRRDRFSLQEVEQIERVNRNLSMSNLLCLMELVRQRPWLPGKGGPDVSGGKPPSNFPELGPMNVGLSSNGQQQDHMSMTAGLPHNSSTKNNTFLSSSPNRSDLMGFQGIDKSRRSSQSPSDISRSQMGNNTNNSKLLNAQNPNHLHQQQGLPLIGNHQFVPPFLSSNQQQQPSRTSPQANRSSPFQSPLSVGAHPVARPPRSHSTIGGLGVGSFNSPYNLTSPQIRQPPAAHQSSSRPNLAGLTGDVIPAQVHPSNVPVTAHMSSKTPQTPKLPDGLGSLPRPSPKNSHPGSLTFGNMGKLGITKDSMLPGQVDIHQHGRPELDPAHGIPMRTLMGLRQQEMANREIALKRSTTPQCLPGRINSQGSNHNIDFARHHGFMDNNAGPQSLNHPTMNSGQSNNPPSSNLNEPMNRNTGQGVPFSSSMGPPSVDHHRQFTTDTNRNSNLPTGSGVPPSTSSESQLKQYNALMAVYQQQQLLMPGKPGDITTGATNISNVTGQIPAHMTMNQCGPQRLSMGEPMHVDIQQPRLTQTQASSPKLANQRSIITGSASAASRKSKKAKPSPTANVQPVENKATNDNPNQVAQKVQHADSGAPVTSVPVVDPLRGDMLMPVESALSSSLSSLKQEPRDTAKSDNIVPATDNSGAMVDGASSACSENPESNIGARGVNISDEESHKNNNISLKLEPDLLKHAEKLGNPLAVVPEPSNNIECILTSNTPKAGTSAEPKQSSSAADVNQHNARPVADPPSKYQKLFTKKAWLQNYDQEDQARANEEALASESKMVVLTRNTSKLEENIEPVVCETEAKEDKPPTPVTKTISNTKNGKSKVENKKKIKEGKAKKANSISAVRANRVTPKSADNDSEETNASTSDMDDTDETDSIKSSSDKKLRRMPRRKVKLNSDRESIDQQSIPTKTKVIREGRDKEVTKRRGKKEKSTAADSEVSGSAKRKYTSDDESVKGKTKKIKESAGKTVEKSDSSPNQKSKKRPGDKFLQTQPCYEIVPKSIRCLECRRVRQSSLKEDKAIQSKQASKTNWDDFCRFFEFRKLRYNKSAQIVVAGFSEASDAKDSDMRLWLPLETAEVPKNITYKVAKFILTNIGDEFCDLVLQERTVLKSYEAKSEDKRTTWKRAVNGLRELCDVCSTTLFNCHHVCDRCGFVVCIDCHRSRAKNHKDPSEDDADIKREGDTRSNCESNQGENADQVAATNKKSKKDAYGWIFCAKNEEHSHDKLTLAKIIAGDCLEEVWTLLHEMRQKLNLGDCSCKKLNKSLTFKNDECKEETKFEINIKQEVDGHEHESSHSTLKGLLLASNNSSVNGTMDTKFQDDSIGSNNNENVNNKAKHQTTSDYIDAIKGNRKSKVFDFSNEDDSQDDSRQVSAAIEGCIASLAADVHDEVKADDMEPDSALIDGCDASSRLCDGDLLVLTYARHKENIKLFREHWRHGKPVLVRGVHNSMNIDMWLPQFFLNKFGDYRSDLVDCRNGHIARQSMRKYWDGFEPSSSKKRVKDDAVIGHIPPANNEEPSAITTSYYSGSALWRLKDWPPGQDFKEILPEHYDDFMNNLPLKSYTTRTGKLNLACRLPKEMLKPDLGPKMYSAYGTTKFPERGTTNLHLDISDAVNVMVYVGGAMPFSQGSSEYSEIYDSTINDCYVDSAMKDQIRQKKLIPGALWHIFRPSDSPKMREFLNKVAEESKISPEKRIDPIHDQVWYLDQNLLDRLYREHGVKSYPILQCMGDAILIPAGAPHQVKNLQNCIKVANDFVSPENIRYCLQLTDEFRNLPETHINQEDKLQIKNIMYHSVKESIQYIKMFESGKVSLSDESSDEDDLDDDDINSQLTSDTLALTT